MQIRANVNSNITTKIHRFTILHNNKKILCPVSIGRRRGYFDLYNLTLFSGVPQEVYCIAHHHPPSWRTLLPKHTLKSRCFLPYFNFSLYTLQYPNIHYIFPHTFGVTLLSSPCYTVSSKKVGGKRLVNLFSYRVQYGSHSTFV